MAGGASASGACKGSLTPVLDEQHIAISISLSAFQQDWHLNEKGRCRTAVVDSLGSSGKAQIPDAISC